MEKSAFIGQETAAAGRQLFRSRNVMDFTSTSSGKLHVAGFVTVEMEVLVSQMQFLLELGYNITYKVLCAIFYTCFIVGLICYCLESHTITSYLRSS